MLKQFFKEKGLDCRSRGWFWLRGLRQALCHDHYIDHH